MSSPDTLQSHFDRIHKNSLIWGVIGVVLCVIFGLRDPQQFYRSYLVGYIFWLCFPLGCMAILMLNHLTGGWWGYPIRRLLEAGTRTLPLMTLLFLPTLFGMPHLYPWARSEDVFADVLLQYKHPYLNPQFFIVRAVLYFAIWLTLAFFLNKWSREQDRNGDPRLAHRMSALSGPGVILWSVAWTFAVIDWIMSLEPHWFSTIYGMLFMIIATLTAMSFVIFLLRSLSNVEPIRSAVLPARFNDLSNLMLVFTMLWAYLAFDQFLLIWSGDVKQEITWYMERAYGPWAPVALALVVLHFAVPFLLLLQRGVSRRISALSKVAFLLIALTLVDIFWLIVPSYENRPRVHLLDIFAVIAVGGLWLAAYFRQLGKMPLLPLHDPKFEGAPQHVQGD